MGFKPRCLNRQLCQLCYNHCPLFCICLKLGHSLPLLLYLRLFYKQLRENNCSIKVGDNWIRTRVLWYRKWQLCQLCHNHCPLFCICLRCRYTISMTKHVWERGGAEWAAAWAGRKSFNRNYQTKKVGQKMKNREGAEGGGGGFSSAFYHLSPKLKLKLSSNFSLIY